MSTTPGYGETPLGSDPEQPEWLRKAFDRKSSGSTPYGAPQYGQDDDSRSSYDAHAGDGRADDDAGQSSGFQGQNAGNQGYAAPGAYPPPGGYSGQPGYPGQGAYPSQGAYPNQANPNAYPPPGYPPPGHAPAGYAPPGSPWAPVDPHAKSRLAAGLLGIFLGAFGIHRFYLGYTGVGVAMLLMTVLSFGILSIVTSIWGLVEGILYLTDKTGNYSRDATGRPLRD